MLQTQSGTLNIELTQGAYCFLCGGRSGPVLFEELGYGARQCDCGVLYTSPFPAQGVVDPVHDLHQESYYELAAPIRAAFLQRYRKSGRLLEVGCGNGHFLREAMARGYAVAGMEPNAGRAAQVREDLGVPVETALIEDTQLPPQSFDIVYHCDLLSHFPDPILALERMTSLVAPDGILYFEVGLVADLAPFWYRSMGTLRMPHHRWFFTEAALERLLARCGLGIVKMKRYGLAPGVLISQIGKLTRTGGGATRRITDMTKRQESRSRRRMRTALRYHVGALVSGIGPETALVIARKTG
jgi:SAM-dependent methyltransferase